MACILATHELVEYLMGGLERGGRGDRLAWARLLSSAERWRRKGEVVVSYWRLGWGSLVGVWVATRVCSRSDARDGGVRDSV